MVATPWPDPGAAPARARAALDTALRQAEALSRLTVALGTVHTADDALAVVLELTTGLLEAHAGIVFLATTEHSPAAPTPELQAARIYAPQEGRRGPPTQTERLLLSADQVAQTIEGAALIGRRPQGGVATQGAAAKLGLLAPMGPEPALAVPGTIDGRPVLVLAWYGIHEPVPKSTVTLLAAIGQRLAQALAQLQAQEVERRRLSQEMLVADMAREAAATLELDALLGRVAERAARLTGADRTNIWLLDAQRGLLIPSALYGMDEAFIHEWKRKPLPLADEPLSREALSTAIPVIVEDPATDPRTDKAAVRFFGDQSILVVPLKAKDRLLGTLFFNHVRQPYRYTPREVGLALTIASQAAIGIENARLFGESQRMGEQLRRSFHRIGQALAAGPDLDPTLQLIVQLASELVGAEACQIRLLDEAWHATKLVSGTGPAIAQPGTWATGALHILARPQLPADTRPPPGTPASGTAGEGAGSAGVGTGAAPAADAPATGGPLGPAAAAGSSGGFQVDLPLVVEGQPIGALSVRRRHEPLTAAEVELLSSFASQASVAIGNARLYARLQEEKARAERRVTELSALYEISRAFSEHNQLSRVTATLVGQLVRLLQPSRCLVWLYDAEADALVAQPPTHGLSEEQAARCRLPLEASPTLARAWRTREPYLAEAGANGAARDDLRELLGSQTALLVPIQTGDQPIGLICVARDTAPFTQDDIRFLKIVATEAAGLVQNALLARAVADRTERLDAIWKYASDAMILVDAQWRIRGLNPAAERLTGWREAEVLGRSCAEMCLNPDEEGVPRCEGACPIWSSLQMHGATEPLIEAAIATRDGRRVDIAASYSFIPSGPGGDAVGVAIIRDVSNLKEAERLKTDFVALVSHELRTPLALIKGYATTLLNPKLALPPGTQERFLRGIDTASDRLRRLVDNVLSVTRIESGAFSRKTELLELREVTAQGVQVMRQQGAHQPIDLIMPDNELWVEADRDQIQQVIENLVGNALKYAASTHPIQVRVAVAHGERTEPTVRVRVIDGGPGVPPDQLDLVFEKFHRVGQGPGSRAHGTGLGLFICKRIVEGHGGRIAAENNPEGGATFWFELPLRA